jgi:hypothetical protein
MINRVGWLPLKDFVYRPEKSKEYLVNASWALYCENFLEGFHIPFVHASLNAAIDYGNYTTQGFQTNLITASLRAAYIVDPKMNLKVELGVADRIEQRKYSTKQIPFVFIGIKTDLGNLYDDY